MEDQEQTSFTFEIDNFSEKEAIISSPTFSRGGCEWFVHVHKGYIVDDHLSLYLHVANTESLRIGWKRRASYSFILLNQSGKDLFRVPESLCQLFCYEFSGRGKPNAVPLKELQEKGFLEKNKLIVKVEVKVVEVVDEGDVTENETFNFLNGYNVMYSQLYSANQLFVEHPNIAVNFRPKSKPLKTTYTNLLLNLIELLNKPPHSLTETDLSNAQIELIDLTEAGFELDWLKTKLADVTLERKKPNPDVSRVQELEEQNKNLNAELKKEKVKSVTPAAKVLLFEQTVSDLKDEVSDLKDEVSDLKDALNKNEEKSDTFAAKFLSLEQMVLNLRADLNKEKGVVSPW
ncbi:unnamed protein product [Microthlaspi erraticum]|uniref:MATH domain-containing protein n=1 Tax=Microthlaspi erraticum TaxID=1685480 RepID=A0A6D2IXC0_9BRAS|nr:unnamed protein product [Microthlaspi erraticum]CAA7032733.1 unnamed protein product [Microthlaspi erraticum]